MQPTPGSLPGPFATWRRQAVALKQVGYARSPCLPYSANEPCRAKRPRQAWQPTPELSADLAHLPAAEQPRTAPHRERNACAPPGPMLERSGLWTDHYSFAADG